jgi:hypothetical protein
LITRFEGGGAFALGAAAADAFECPLACALTLAFAALLAVIFAGAFAAPLAGGRFGALAGALLARAVLDLIRGIGMNLRCLDRLCHCLVGEWLSGPGLDGAGSSPAPCPVHRGCLGPFQMVNVRRPCQALVNDQKPSRAVMGPCLA